MSGGTVTKRGADAAGEPLDAVDAATTADAPGGSGRRRRRRRSNSLAAQGEPAVWLIGGGLTVCVLMIVGLLALIFVQGVSTFWPKRLVEVQLSGGDVVLGEVTRGEWFSPNALPENEPEMVGEDVVAEEAEAATGGAVIPEMQHRRLLRIGNRDLTGTPFRWIPDAVVEGETQPEWAVLIERRTWGPFIGMPQQFVERHDREIGDQEAALAAQLTFFNGAFGALEAEERDAAVAAVQERLDEVRAEQVAAFVEPFEDVEDRRVEAELADGTRVPLAELEPGADVRRVREIWEGEEATWAQFEAKHDAVLERREERWGLERHELGELNYVQESARLAVRSQELEHEMRLLELARAVLEATASRTQAERRLAELEQREESVTQLFGASSDMAARAQKVADQQREGIKAEIEQAEQQLAEHREALAELPESARQAIEHYVQDVHDVQQEQAGVLAKIEALNHANERLEMKMATAGGAEAMLMLAEVVRGYPANQLSWLERVGVYGSRWWEFVSDNPREANQEGGVFPPIIGTVVMTLLMCFVVVPFGVLAALYLREYAKPGPIVSAVRIAVNNLAGVPSIVFGVFGLGFFCYIVGGYVDEGPANPAAQTPWMLMLGLLLLVAAIAVWATMVKFRASDDRQRHIRLLGYALVMLWLVVAGVTVWLVVKVPFFDGFYAARAADGSPTFRKGGVLWASLTLALLTLPVVIVATEEALAAVPSSMREGSYACGASKWQTVRRIVLPRAMPGIMTGMILAMARGAGEVAPLMLVGAVTLAQELPMDTMFPYVHLDRSFMHLGFHIYDVGFQSPDSEGAKPMVYTTTLLLVGIIATLNMAAFGLRSRLRRRFAGSQF